MSNISVGLIWIKAAGNSPTGTYKELRVCRGRHLLTPLRCFHWDWIMCALCRREHSGEIGVGRAGSQRTNPCGPFWFDFGSGWAAWGGGLGTENFCCDPKLSEVILYQLYRFSLWCLHKTIWRLKNINPELKINLLEWWKPVTGYYRTHFCGVSSSHCSNFFCKWISSHEFIYFILSNPLSRI